MRNPFLLLIGLMLVVGTVTGCNKEEAAAIESKCDASLRLKAEEMLKAGDDTPLDVLGKATGTVDDAMRTKLTKAGATLSEVREDLFVARIAPRKLGSVALLDFVKSLELSKTLEPLGH
jgi:hypothetical protein